MIEPWTVWAAQLSENPEVGEYCLVVSSEFHIRANVGRLVTVVPVSDVSVEIDYRVPITNPQTGELMFVVTEQIRTISAVLHPVNWTLTDDEIARVKHALKHMVAF